MTDHPNTEHVEDSSAKTSAENNQSPGSDALSAAAVSLPLVDGPGFSATKRGPIYHGPSSGIGRHLSALMEMSEAAGAEAKKAHSSSKDGHDHVSVPSFELRDEKEVRAVSREEDGERALVWIARSLELMAESQARIAAARERSLLLEERLAEQHLKNAKLEERSLKDNVRFFGALRKRAKVLLPLADRIFDAAQKQLDNMSQGQDLSLPYPVPAAGYDEPLNESDPAEDKQ